MKYTQEELHSAIDYVLNNSYPKAMCCGIWGKMFAEEILKKEALCNKFTWHKTSDNPPKEEDGTPVAKWDFYEDDFNADRKCVLAYRKNTLEIVPVYQVNMCKNIYTHWTHLPDNPILE